jgi:hypothetical protein
MAFAFYAFLFLFAVSGCFEPQGSLVTSANLSDSSLLTDDIDRTSDDLVYAEPLGLNSEVLSTFLNNGDDATPLGDLSELPWDNDVDPTPLIFADSNEACHLSRLRSRGGAASCVNPAGSSGDTDSDNARNTPSIDPKLLQFIDVQKMELKEICPSQPHIPYSIAVCSSSRKEDTHPFEQSWVLTHAQRGRCRSDLMIGGDSYF